MTIARKTGRKGSPGWYKQKATELHSRIVRARGRCERCGIVQEPAMLQAAHIVRRSYAWTRTDVSNAWSACPRCHWLIDNDAYEFMQLVDRTIGQDKFQALRRKALDGVNRKMQWDVELARLQEIAKEMGL